MAIKDPYGFLQSEEDTSQPDDSPSGGRRNRSQTEEKDTDSPFNDPYGFLSGDFKSTSSSTGSSTRRTTGATSTDDDADDDTTESRRTPGSALEAVGLDRPEDVAVGGIDDVVDRTIQQTQFDTDRPFETQGITFATPNLDRVFKDPEEEPITALAGMTREEREPTTIQMAREALIGEGTALNDLYNVWSEGVKNVRDIGRDVLGGEEMEVEPEDVLSGAGEALSGVPENTWKGFSDFVTLNIPKATFTFTKAFWENLNYGDPDAEGSMAAQFEEDDRFTFIDRDTFNNFREEVISGSDFVLDYIKDEQQARMRAANINPDAGITDPNNFAYQLGSGGASLGLAMGIGVLGNSTGMAASVLGSIEGAESYEASKEGLRESHPDWSEEKIRKRSLGMLLLNAGGIAALEKVGLDALFRNYAGSMIRKSGINMLTESQQEGAQQLFQNMTAKYGYDSEQALGQDVFDSMFVAAPLGFFGGGVTGAIQKYQRNKERARADEVTVRAWVQEQFEPNQAPILPSHVDLSANVEVQEGSQAEETIINAFAEEMDMDYDDAEALYRVAKPVIDDQANRFQDGTALREQGQLQNQIGREVQNIVNETDQQSAEEYLQENYNLTEEQAQNQVQEALEVSEEAMAEVDNVINEVRQEVEAETPTEVDQQAEIDTQIQEAEEFVSRVRPQVEQQVGAERVEQLPELARQEAELRQQIEETEGEERDALVSDLDEIIRQRRTTEADIADLETRRQEQGNLYTENAQRTAEIFQESAGQEQIGDTDYEIGDFGRSSQARKLGEKQDRFPEAELESTLENTIAVRRASDDRTTHRYDNIAHIAEMEDGSLRAVYTRRNNNGNEEVVNWHEVSNQDFLEDILDNSAPDRNRAQALIQPSEQRTAEEISVEEEEGTARQLSSNQQRLQGILEEESPDTVTEEDRELIETTGRTVEEFFEEEQSIEELEAELQEAYQQAENAEEELGNLLVELELAEPGQRIIEDGEVIAWSSSFPDWMSDDVRTRDYVETALEAVTDLENIQYPTNPRANRQREAVDDLLTKLDDRLGIDTSEIRGNILSRYGEQAQTTQREAQRGVQRGEGGDQAVQDAIERFQTVQPDILTYSEEEMDELSDEELNQELLALSEEEMDALVLSDQGNMIFHQMDDRLSNEALSKYAGYLHDNNLDTTNFNDYNRVTTNVLEALGDKKNVHKNFIKSKLNEVHKNIGVRKSERNLIENTLEDMEGDRVDVQEFKNRVKSQILPLNIQGLTEPILSYQEAKRLERQAQEEGTKEAWQRYYDYYETFEALELGRGDTKVEGRLTRFADQARLSESIRGQVEQYDEHIFESPIKTSAGNVHGFHTDHYFAHVRVEDMADGETRRLIEVQSDLMQRGRLDREGETAVGASFQEETEFLDDFEDWLMTEQDMSQEEAEDLIASGSEEATELQIQFEQEAKERAQERIEPLRDYENYWWERVIREEIRRAAIDRKGEVLLPTGETAMRIEGLDIFDNELSAFFDQLRGTENDIGKTFEFNGAQMEVVEVDFETNLTYAAEQVGITRRDSLREYLSMLWRTDENNRLFKEPGNQLDLQETDEIDQSYEAADEIIERANNSEDPMKYIHDIVVQYHGGQVNAPDFFLTSGDTIRGRDSVYTLKDGTYFDTISSIKDEAAANESNIDTSNPIFRFYENDIGDFLNKNFDTDILMDENGVEWFKVNIEPEMASQPVVAYKKTNSQGIYRDSPHIMEIKARKDDVPFDMDEEQGREWFRHLFGSSVRQMAFDVESGPRDYWGSFTPRKMFDKSLVKFATFRGQVQSRVVYHEGFHGAFRMFFTQEERQQVLDNIKDNIPARFTQEVLRLGDTDNTYFTEDQRAEEWLANDFARFYEWKMQLREDKAHALENEKWYETLLRKIRDWIRKTTGAQEIYNDILQRVDSSQLENEQENLDNMIIEGADALPGFENIDMQGVLEAINNGRTPQSQRIPEVYEQLEEDYQEYKEEGVGKRPGALVEFYQAIDNYKEGGILDEDHDTMYKKASDSVNEFTVSEEEMSGRFRRKVQDQNARIDNVQKQLLEQGAVINSENDVFLAKTLMPRRIGNQFKELNNDIIEPFVESLVNDDLSIEEFDAYAHALHAPRRNEIMRDQRDYEGDDGSGLSNEEAQEIINDFRDQGKLPALEKHRNKMRQVQKTIQAFQLENGLISREELKAWVRIYGDDYVPLGRDMGRDSETGVAAGRVGQGTDVRGKESKRAYGSDKQVLPITAQIFNQYRRAIMRAEHAKVGRTLLQFIRDNNENGEMSGLFKIEKQQYVPRYDKDGEMLYMDPQYVNDPSYIGVKVDGDQYYIQMKDELYARAMKETGLTSGWGTHARFVHFLSAMITQYSPGFALRNFQRDFFEGMINLQEVVDINLSQEERKGISRQAAMNTPGLVKDVFRFERDNKGKISEERLELIKRFKKAGGEVGYFWTVNADEAMTNLQRLQRELQGDMIENAKKPLKKVGEFVDSANTAVEIAIRVSVFDQLTQRGVAENVAAEIAGDLTVDFNKMGEWGPLMKSLWMFSNPAIQGPARMMRAMANSNKARIASIGMVAGGFINGMLSMMFGGDGDDDIEEYNKNTKIVFATPDGGQVTVFYLPYGYNAFWAFGRNMSELMMGKRTVSETVRDTFTASLDSFNPLGGSRASFTNILPSGFKPVGEASINVGWHGGPISPEQPPYQPKLPDSQLYWDSVSDSSKFVAQFLNKMTGGNERESGVIDVSPETIEYMVRAYTGSVGKLFHNSFDTTINFVTGDEVKSKNIPIIRDYYRQIDTKRAKQETIYSMLEESGRTEYGELRTNRFMDALDTLVERGDMEEGYAQSLRTDFKNNQSELQTGMDLEENAINKELKEFNLGNKSRGEAFRSALTEIAGDDPETREVTDVKKKFRLYETFGFNDPNVEAVQSGTSNDARAEILFDMRQEMGAEQFDEFLRKARTEVETASGRTSHILISDDLLKKLRARLQQEGLSL